MMGKQSQAERKWKLRLLVCVALFRIALSATNIYEPSPVYRISSVVKLSPTENTGSTVGASPFQHLQVRHHFQSDEAHFQSDIAALPDVSLTCGRSDFVVRVKPAFYGLGAAASELRLGSTCQSNGALGPYGDLLFKYALTACDSELELFPGYLVYKFVLHYDPSPERFPSKANPVTVNIECRYPRNYHMHQLAVQPTWETLIVHKMLKASQSNFQIQLMDGTWANPIQSRVFQLGETVNVQVSAPHLSPGQKVYINWCYATPVTHLKSHIKFTIIDNYGCLLDSKTFPGASKFISRNDESVRFSMKAFQFVSDPDAEISMNCQFYVTTAGPSPAHKSCTYTYNSWEALSGDDAICECCDSQCVISKRHRAMMDGIISSGSLWVSSHSDSSNSRENLSDVHMIHDATDKANNPKQVHPGEINIVMHKEETFGEIDLKLVKELKWSPVDNEREVVESKHVSDLRLWHYTTKRRGDQRLTPETTLNAENRKPTDENVKAEIKEVFEQENSGDELDGKTWYFAWT
uniref:Zona pellucida sperm-binding protein 3 n=1 Tax=Neogobius melanostomus TaxID=47308 RepID=A0A8C6UIW7_9GOBI